MSVVIETTHGNIVVDLLDEGPLAYNFLKLCKLKRYFFNVFFGLKSDAIVSCGVPDYPASQSHSSISQFVDISAVDSSMDTGVEPRNGMLDLSSYSQDVTALEVGSVSFTKENNCIGSQFTVVLGNTPVDTQNMVPFAKVAEGFNTLVKINSLAAESDVRILHTHILHDPFPDPVGLKALIPRTLFPSELQLSTMNIPSLAASTQIEALTLELIGDLPRYDVKPAPNVLFVTRLNPVTEADALEIIFARFGAVSRCTVVKDAEGKSKRYGFIEFATKEEAENAYDKLHHGCIIDGQEVVIDFSQSTRAKKLT